MFKVGDKVYNIRNENYHVPYIQEFIVVKQTSREKKTGLIPLAPVSHPDSPSLREYDGKSGLSHTVAEAEVMLNNIIDERIQKVKDIIEQLEAGRVPKVENFVLIREY